MKKYLVGFMAIFRPGLQSGARHFVPTSAMLTAVIYLFSAAQAYALDCSVQSSLDAPNTATPDDVSRFVLESKQSVKGSELVAIGKISALSEPVTFQWHASRRADIEIERYFRKPAQASTGSALSKNLFPVFIPATGFVLGQRVLVIASPEPESYWKSRRFSQADKAGSWPLRMWLAHTACWRGTYAEGSKNYQTLFPALSAWQNNKDAPGELRLTQLGDVEPANVVIQSLDGKFVQNHLLDWATPTLRLPAGKYTVTWPVQAGWGFSCFFDKPSTQRCEFEIEPGLPTEVRGRYTDYPEPILRLLDTDGKPMLTTAALKWYGDGDAVKGLSARLEGLGYTVSDYPLTQLALTAAWHTSAEAIGDTSQCKKQALNEISVPVSELGSNKYHLVIDMQPGVAIYQTHIDPATAGWLSIRFEGELTDDRLLVSAACDEELDLVINKLPATIFVPRGQTIEYRTGLYGGSTKALVNAATTIILHAKN